MIKKFSKEELLAVGIIFVILITVSVPNFLVSLRRARDQTRKDDIGAIKSALDIYNQDFGGYPLSTSDGRFLACLKEGDTVEVDKDGRLRANLIPCEWGKDGIVDLTPGSDKIYIDRLAQDPRGSQGVRYSYYSDGARYQIFAALEGKDDAEFDSAVVGRNIECGSRTCNLGRGYGCSIEKTLDKCREEQEGRK